VTAIDQAVRDRAIHQTDRCFALAAGAGSGKTSVLTQRVLQLLVDGIAPRRIAAITFTEKAAGELQERVRDALEARVAAAPSPTLRQALAELPDLQLSTIHAFCQRLLTLESLEAGWAPDTELLPAVMQSEGVAQAYRAWRRGFAARHPLAALLVRSLVKGVTLRDGAVRMLATRDLTPVTSPLSFDPARAHGALLEAHQQLLDAATLCQTPDTDKLLANNASMLRGLADAAPLPAEQAVLRVLMSGDVGKKSGGRAGDWRGAGKQDFLTARQALDDWHHDQRVRLHGVLVRDLHEHFVPAAQAAKASRAVADFDDLLFRAAELLGDDRVRRRLAGRFDALLVDEVQDTDPIQAEVAALLARSPEVTGPWDAHPPEPGRLFAVGDPRQSIYRFRRADVATWGALRELIVAGGEGLTLQQNFRSVPGIVDWVNHTFADLPGYTPQQAYRAPASLPPVVRLPCDDDDDDELDVLARYLHHMKATGSVVDRASGAPRPVRWGDVMLLLPAWSKAETLQATLSRADIPCLVEGGGGFFERDEVRVAMAALRALEEPADAASTVLALRGLFGLDWAQLAAHRAADGAWRYTVPDPPPGPVAEAFGVLRELARLRGRHPWVELLDELLSHTRAAAVWAALPDGEARLANLDKLRALLRQAERAATSSGEVLRTLEGLDQEQDLSRSDLDSDAVRVTSYFKAKGLEAPVVVVCFGRRSRSGVTAAIDRERREVAHKITPLVPPDWERREAVDKEADAAERARWMYVAATRARDQLVMVDRAKHQLVHDHLGAGLEGAQTVSPGELPAVAWREQTFRVGDDTVDGWLRSLVTDETDATAAWQAAHAQRVRRARAGCVRWRSVHDVAAQERVARASSPVGVAGGQVVHDVMEALDLSRPLKALQGEVDGLVAAAAFERGLDSPKQVACGDIVRALLVHPVMDRARAAPERWIEVPFAIEDEGRMVSGRIDLAFPTDESRARWVVVDWKSDLPARGTPAWRNYQRQLSWYAKALLATVSPCEEVETVLVGPYPVLGDGPGPAERVGQVLPELAPGLTALLDRGLPVPRVGADVGEPIVALAELAFDEARVALCVGQPEEDVADLRRQGWKVVAVEPEGLTWSEEGLAGVVAALGFTGEQSVMEPDRPR